MRGHEGIQNPLGATSRNPILPSISTHTHCNFFSDPHIAKTSSPPPSTTPSRTMTINSKHLAFLFLSISSVSLLAHSADDPEVELCKKQCQLQTQFDKRQRRACQYQCQDYGRQKAEAAAVGERERELRRCEHQCRSSQLSEEEREECARKCEEHRGAARDGEGERRGWSVAGISARVLGRGGEASMSVGEGARRGGKGGEGWKLQYECF